MPSSTASAKSPMVYVPGPNVALGDAALASNENPLGPGPAALRALNQACLRPHRYPSPRAEALRGALSAHHDLPIERVLCAHGAEELLRVAMSTFAGPDQEVVLPRFAFRYLAISATLAGARVIEVPEKALTVDLDAMLQAVTSETSVVALANPANPTGTAIQASELVAFREALPDPVVLLVDEAYAELASGRFSSCLPLAATSARTLVVRSFSKSYGLAGLRVGWGVADPALVGALKARCCPFGPSGPGQAAAVAALGDGEQLERSRDWAARARETLPPRLLERGLEVVEPSANFVLVGLGSSTRAQRIHRELTERGVHVRSLGMYGLDEHLRISFGLDEDHERLISALDEVMP